MSPIRTLCTAAVASVLAACGDRHPPADMGATAQDAKAFVSRVNREFRELGNEQSAAGWVQATYITPDTQFLSARADERFLTRFSELVQQAKAFDGVTLDAADARALKLLRLGVSAPAPDDPDRRAELTRLTAGLEAAYGQSKGCHDEGGKEVCRTVEELDEIMATSRDYDTRHPSLGGLACDRTAFAYRLCTLRRARERRRAGARLRRPRRAVALAGTTCPRTSFPARSTGCGRR